MYANLLRSETIFKYILDLDASAVFGFKRT